MFDRTKSDLRFAARMLRRSPVFTTVAVLAISLGSGAVTTIFSAMNAIVLRPVPGVPNGGRVVALEFRQRDATEQMESYALYGRLRNGPTTLAGLAAWRKITVSVAGPNGGTVVSGNLVSGNYFSVLGVTPAVGRFFSADEDEAPLTHPVVVLSHGFWTSKMGGDSGIVGRTVRVNGNPYVVIGVAPQDFVGVTTPVPADAWITLSMQGQLLPNRDLATPPWLRMFGRLAPGKTPEAAQAELSTIAVAASAELHPARAAARVTGVSLSMLRSVPEDARKPFLGFMALLLGAATLVLFVASVNVASLLSARAIARRREMAVRAALGAGRGRLVSQLLTEVLLLFTIGAAGGILVAFAATRGARSISLPLDIIVAPDMTPDLRVMAFALAVCLVTGLVFGLAPALRASRDDVVASLRDASGGSGPRRRRTDGALVVGQLAVSLVLLVVAGLFLRTLSIGERVDPGFDRSDLAIAKFDAQTWGYDSTQMRAFYSALREGVSALPGVSSAAYASYAPLTTRSMNDNIATGGDSIFVWYTSVSGSYFETLKLPILAGRAIADRDDARAPRVAVVNQTLAHRLAPHGNAVGRTFTFHQAPITVVGIARDAKYASLAEETPPMAYFPTDQMSENARVLLVRTRGDLMQLQRRIRDVTRAVDPALPISTASTLDRASGISVLPQRIGSIVTASLGGLGLLLAVLGLYGIVAYSVNRRMREFGVRVALGARRLDIVKLVVAEGLRLAVVGVAVGLGIAFATTRLIGAYLFDVSPLDPLTFAGMSMLLVAVTLPAMLPPARRAAADPMAALREQ